MKIAGDKLVASCGLIAFFPRAPFCSQTIKKHPQAYTAEKDSLVI